MSALAQKSLARVLVVDDDSIVAQTIAAFLTGEGFDAQVALSADEAWKILSREGSPSTPRDIHAPFDVVVCDVSLPRRSGLDLLREATALHPDLAFIMITGYGTIESAVEAIRIGAVDYLSKPIIDSELQFALQRALRQHALLAENRSLRSQLDHKFGLENVIGADYRMAKAIDLISAVAPSKATVLMTGESGTGKSLIARAIHRLSPRADKPFIELQCGSIPETLLESELFGHVKGSFTGAHTDKAGRFLAADNGTIFLDEINSASPAMQLKLLRVVQERRFEPVGSNQTIEVDVRIILASNQPLERLVAEGKFRQDLYYRVNVVSIELPPLRDRTGDIPRLVEHFLRKHGETHLKTVTSITPQAMDALVRYTYPGNVRELENLIERAVVLSHRPTVDIDLLPPHVLENTPGTLTHDTLVTDDAEWKPVPLDQALLEPERAILLRALRANNWNRQATADQLQINRTTLYKKMKLHNLDRLAG